MKTPPLLPEAGEMLRLCELVYEDIPTLASSSTTDTFPETGYCVYTDPVDISDARWDVDAFMAHRRSTEPDSPKHCRVKFGANNKPAIAPPPAVDVVVAVRGTESWADIKADLKVCKSGKADTSCLTRVHCGFLSCAFALLEPVYARIIEVARQQQRNPTVWITGHSLGGAVATLLAYMLCHLKELPEGVALRVCTFGSPRVGNWWFREAYNAMDAITTYRFCTDRDIITCMPCFNYWHVGQRIVLDTTPKPEQLTPAAAGCGRFVTRFRLPVCFSAHKLVSYRAALERQQQPTH